MNKDIIIKVGRLMKLHWATKNILDHNNLSLSEIFQFAYEKFVPVEEVFFATFFASKFSSTRVKFTSHGKLVKQASQ